MKGIGKPVILAGLVCCVIWGGLFYYFAQVYPDEWELMLRFGLGVPLLVIWYAMGLPEVVSDSVESISDERLRDFLKILPDLPFWRYIVWVFVFAVFILLMKAVSMF